MRTYTLTSDRPFNIEGKICKGVNLVFRGRIKPKAETPKTYKNIGGFRCLETGEYYEREADGVSEFVKFWSACLRRAERYWSMEVETLDAIQAGEMPDEDE